MNQVLRNVTKSLVLLPAMFAIVLVGYVTIRHEPLTGYDVGLAIMEGNTERALRLLKQHPDWATDEYSSLLMSDAIRYENPQVIRTLVEMGFDLNATRYFRTLNSDSEPRPKDSPLSEAVTYHQFELAKLLVELGANPNEHLRSATILAKACETHLRLPDGAKHWTLEEHEEYQQNVGSARLALIEALLEAGADPNLSSDRSSMSAIVTAVWNGRADFLKPLLEHGGNPNAMHPDGCPLLAKSELEVTWQRVNHFDRENLPPDREGVHRLLLEYGAAKHDEAGILLVKDALNSDDLQQLKELLDLRPELTNLYVYNHGSPKTIAARAGRMDVLEELLARGVDLNEVDPDGETALAIATLEQNVETVVWLLDHDANPNLGDGAYEPLDVAVRRQNAELVRLLLSRGANVDGQSRFSTPLRSACSPSARRSVDHEIVQILLDAGGDPHAPDSMFNAVVETMGRGDWETFQMVLRKPVRRPERLLVQAMRLAQATKNPQNREVALKMIRRLVEFGASTESFRRDLDDFDEDIRKAAGFVTK
ncbi:MAG: ankyrin repeat domain-containing protein [Planctomycetaceae bacterium]